MTALWLLVALAAEPAAVASDAPLYDQGGRVRFGSSVEGGVRTLTGTIVVEAEVRLGVQVTRWWSAFLLVKAQLAPGLTSTSLGIAGAQVEAMLTDHVSFAVGPVLAYGTFGGLVEDGRRPEMVSEPAGPSVKPGFDVRLALCTAKSRPPTFSRMGLSIGAELLGLYHYGLASNVLGTRAGFSPTQPWWDFTPMITLGVDTR